jgi:tellurite resistance protein TehA-like permease
VRRFPLRYDPLYWGAVFPLGMYTVATQQMAEAKDLGFLQQIPQVFVCVAIVAWAVTFAGLLASLWNGLMHWARRGAAG